MGRAPGPRDPKGHKSIVYSSLARYFVLSLNSPPAVNATSPDELQSAAWGGGGLRDPEGSQKQGPILRPILLVSGCALREWASATEGFGPRDPKGRKSTASLL